MINEMKIIRFENGKYSVRKGNWFCGYRFADLKSQSFWWSMNSCYLNYCQGTLDECKDYIKTRTISE